MNKKLNFVISEQGNSGKSHITSGIIDVLRNIFNKETAGYLLDVEQVAVLNRLGERRENGKLVLPQTNPLTGIVSFDILNQNNQEEGKAYKEAQRMFKTLENDAEYSVYDFPGQGRSALQKMFRQDELAYAIETADKDVNVIIPIVERKSLINILKVKEMFTFTDDFEHLNERVKFLVIHNPINVKNDFTLDDYKDTPEHKAFSQLSDRYQVVKHTNIASEVLDLVVEKPFTHYFNTTTNKAQNLTDKMVEFGEMNMAINLRRVLKNDTGFIKIVENYIL